MSAGGRVSSDPVAKLALPLAPLCEEGKKLEEKENDVSAVGGERQEVSAEAGGGGEEGLRRTEILRPDRLEKDDTTRRYERKSSTSEFGVDEKDADARVRVEALRNRTAVGLRLLRAGEDQVLEAEEVERLGKVGEDDVDKRRAEDDELWEDSGG